MAGVVNTKKEVRPQPSGAPTATAREAVTPGGEEEFVRAIIRSSLMLRTSIKWYTTMLGKKSSLVTLRQLLDDHKLPYVAATEFCQGKTMRWGLAWSFLSNMKDIPPSMKKLRLNEQNKGKKHPPLMFTVPFAVVKRYGGTREDIRLAVIDFLRDLEIRAVKETTTDDADVYVISAMTNTWVGRRQHRRRQMQVSDSCSGGNTEHGRIAGESSGIPAVTRESPPRNFLSHIPTGSSQLVGDTVHIHARLGGAVQTTLATKPVLTQLIPRVVKREMAKRIDSPSSETNSLIGPGTMTHEREVSVGGVPADFVPASGAMKRKQDLCDDEIPVKRPTLSRQHFSVGYAGEVDGGAKTLEIPHHEVAIVAAEDLLSGAAPSSENDPYLTCRLTIRQVLRDVAMWIESQDRINSNSLFITIRRKFTQ